MNTCPYCKEEIKTGVYFSTVCPSCGKELHTCQTCSFYSPGSHYDCRESIEEPVRDKNRRNYCDFFRFRTEPEEQPDTKSKTKSREEAKALLDSLFS